MSATAAQYIRLAVFGLITASLQILPAAAAQGAIVPDFSGIWGHGTLPWLVPPAAGPGPVTNKARRPDDGTSDYSLLVGDYTNPVLQPWAAQVVKSKGELSLAGEVFPSPANQCWPFLIAQTMFPGKPVPARFLKIARGHVGIRARPPPLNPKTRGCGPVRSGGNSPLPPRAQKGTRCRRGGRDRDSRIQSIITRRPCNVFARRSASGRVVLRTCAAKQSSKYECLS